MSATILMFPGVHPLDDVLTHAADPSPRLGHLPPEPPMGLLDGKPKPLTARALDRPRRALTAEEQKLQDTMLEMYFQGVRGAKNHAPSTIRSDRNYVLQFLTYVGQPLWACTASDFEAWAAHLALERHLASGTQRVMQGAIAAFYDYLAHNTHWQNAVRTQFDARLEQVATSENRVVHTTDKNRKRERTYLTGEELTQIFAVMESVVELAALEAPRQLKTFQRDRVMFYTYYAYGLRLDEGHGLSFSSFFRNADAPEMGRYGFASVWGKGSRGSGPRYRCVPCTRPDVPPLLDWYLEEVRPKFECRNPEAIWLSTRGNRLSRSGIGNRFKRVIRACGLDEHLFSPHGLRHMSVTHQAEAGVPLAFTSQTHGHVNMATTTTYTHLSDAFLRNTARNVISASLAAGDNE